MKILTLFSDDEIPFQEECKEKFKKSFISEYHFYLNLRWQNLQ